MNVGDEGAEDRARAVKRGKRLVIAIYGTFAALFVAVSAYEITVQCFGLSEAPIETATPVGGECARGLLKLEAAIDRAAEQAAGIRAKGTEDARAEFERALAPGWADEPTTKAACEQTPRGADALAALLRVRDAERTQAVRGAAELTALRRALAAYVGPSPAAPK